MGAIESHLNNTGSSTQENRNASTSTNTLHRDFLSFFVNGREYTVKTDRCDPDIGPNYLLVDYLRDKLGLTGTKFMCREGGCGSCMVSVKSVHPVTGEAFVNSVNSCLLPLYSCDGLDITTIEGLGNQRVGYDKLQDSMVKFAGTQCGYCTPGMIMNMYSVREANPRFTPSDVEYSFDGNICRCTGFRSIMDAFKSLSVNPSEDLKRQCVDIEDSYMCPLKTKLTNEPMDEDVEIVHVPRNLYLRGQNGEHWVKVTTLHDLFDTLQEFVSARFAYRLVAGNTGTGVYKNDGPYDGFIEINDIPELKYTSIDQTGIVLGGNVTLTAAIDMFDKATKMEGLVYAKEFFDHFRRVACLSVRNRGTLAGNLMLKHMHNEFYSDVFLLFETIGARLRIGSSMSLYENYSLVDFLKVDMTGRVILSIHLPVYGKEYTFRSFKIGKRYQNASAYVNAAFLLPFDPQTMTILSQPRICYGGINPNFVHAYQTEEYLSGKQLSSVVLQKAMKYLEYEVVPDSRPASASPAYRTGLAQSYLYKFLLQIMGNVVTPALRSGAYEIERALNKGYQYYDTDQSKWPLNQPIPKIESYPQTSGEAEFINDIRSELNELHGAFVLTTVGNATIKSIDASQAMKIPGVVGFYTAKDIPGVNNTQPYSIYPEEVFIASTVKYAGQAVGLLVARSRQIALAARSQVKVIYENVQPPLLDIVQAVNNLPKDSNLLENLEKLNISLPCKAKGIDKRLAKQILHNVNEMQIDDDDADTTELVEEDGGPKTLRKLSGEFQSSTQYHFHMETQMCICIPNEDGMQIYSSTQCMDIVHVAVANVLNIPHNSIKVTVRRLGGGFGGKSTRPSMIACACAVAAHITNQPVRVVLDLETNMQMVGKRLPYLAKYEVHVDETGKIYKLDSKVYCDAGSPPNEPTSLYGMISMQSCYRAKNWNIVPGVVSTNTATNTFCRAPGSSQGVAIIETIMEQIAHTLNIDPLRVREVNLIQKGDPFIGVPGAKLPLKNPVPAMIAELKANCDYDSRKSYVDTFNMSNRWKKRGIAIVNARYANYFWDFRFPTFISVYHLDGTVNISHGGIEMGQGVNTKVAQVVAYTLGIPLEKVKVQPSDTLISPSTAISGGSVTSELVCSSARKACMQLLDRLAPIRKLLNNPTWEQLITAANASEVLLTSQFQEVNGDVQSYDVWGVACTEVEVDVLTGDYKIVRSDIVQDVGQSLNPLVDIGQIEGAFVMGLGWWLTEECIYDKTTGVLLTDNTWTYKPMLPADVPEDFRVSILKKSSNPFGVLSSKAVGEPPFNLSVCAIIALRHAIDSARRDVGDENWYQMDGPVTREKVRDLSLTSATNFTLK